VLAAIHQQQGLQALQLQARLLQQRLTRAALDRGETEHTAPVVSQQKSHPSVAKQALPVKHHDQRARCVGHAHSANAVVFLTSSMTA
jgi:hypothetical protein